MSPITDTTTSIMEEVKKILKVELDVQQEHMLYWAIFEKIVKLEEGAKWVD